MSPKRKRPPFLPSLHPSKVRTARSVFSGMERFRRAILCPCAFERLCFKTATCPPSIFLREEAFALRHFRSAPRPPVGNACGVAQGLRNENGISGCRGAVRRTRGEPCSRDEKFAVFHARQSSLVSGRLGTSATTPPSVLRTGRFRPSLRLARERRASVRRRAMSGDLKFRLAFSDPPGLFPNFSTRRGPGGRTFEAGGRDSGMPRRNGLRSA